MIFHNGFGSKKKSSKVNLSVDWDWFYDSLSSRLYIFLPDNPGQYPIEVVSRNGIGFSSSKFITIRNLEIAFARFGIGLFGASDWVIDNVYIHDIVECGIQGNNSSNDITVSNSRFQDWNWRGLTAKNGDGEDFMGYGIQILGGSRNWTVLSNRLTIANMVTP